ncbi:uncharacterized protein EV422DRAFT_543822 [Fimicolochytrium jonesii]|uniref:uncharacterized protein n=1 Tax=Fimicolochytrium jonesii TaxID=1396493 RepID=UPI0022FE0916|nr:uncharacterized protein EV422DRAFT_543822 [Fimicolochytrium jonesii]KAI8816990.1 hypothetical protein EV422DRAFT_543822 [Fimicolochytrium jonesii]
MSRPQRSRKQVNYAEVASLDAPLYQQDLSSSSKRGGAKTATKGKGRKNADDAEHVQLAEKAGDDAVDVVRDGGKEETGKKRKSDAAQDGNGSGDADPQTESPARPNKRLSVQERREQADLRLAMERSMHGGGADELTMDVAQSENAVGETGVAGLENDKADAPKPKPKPATTAATKPSTTKKQVTKRKTTRNSEDEDDEPSESDAEVDDEDGDDDDDDVKPAPKKKTTKPTPKPARGAAAAHLQPSTAANVSSALRTSTRRLVSAPAPAASTTPPTSASSATRPTSASTSTSHTSTASPGAAAYVNALPLRLGQSKRAKLKPLLKCVPRR